MKTQVEITPEMEPRLKKLEAELRKDLAGELEEAELSLLIAYLKSLAFRYHDGQAAKEIYGLHDQVSRQLKDALNANLEYQQVLALPAVQKEITHEAIRRTTPALKEMVRDEQDKLIFSSLKRLLAAGKPPAIYAQIEELEDQQLDIEAALATRGGRPTEELLESFALAVGAGLIDVGITPTTTPHKTFDWVFRATLEAAGFPSAGDLGRYLRAAVKELKKRGKL